MGNFHLADNINLDWTDFIPNYRACLGGNIAECAGLGIPYAPIGQFEGHYSALFCCYQVKLCETDTNCQMIKNKRK